MIYKKINFEIKKAENTTTIKGNSSNGKYLQFTCINPCNIDEPPHKVTTFNEQMVKYYEKLLPKKLGGLLEDEGWTEEGMPKEARVFVNGQAVQVDLGGNFVQKYSNDIVRGEQVLHEKGDVICYRDTNTPKIITTATVFCQYYFEMVEEVDEFGMPILDENFRPKKKMLRDKDGLPIKRWVQGWSPEERIEERKSMLTPYEAWAAEAGVQKPSAHDVVEGQIAPEDAEDAEAGD